VQYLRTYTSPSELCTWDNCGSAEIAQIERLKRACGRIDYYWDVECGCSDEGDPWCAVYDWRRDRLILHIARIDGHYVTAFPSRLGSSSNPTLRAAIDAALTGLFFTCHASKRAM
jgi:hypothetical protein